MAAAAHNPAFAKKVGIPAKVAKEFNQADKGKKFKQGGEMAVKKFDPKKLFKGKESVGEELKEAKAIKSGKITPMQYAKGEKSEPVKKMKGGGSCMKKGGAVKKMAPAKKMKAGGSCYKEGGFVRAADGCATKGKTKGRFI